MIPSLLARRPSSFHPSHSSVNVNGNGNNGSSGLVTITIMICVIIMIMLPMSINATQTHSRLTSHSHVKDTKQQLLAGLARTGPAALLEPATDNMNVEDEMAAEMAAAAQWAESSPNTQPSRAVINGALNVISVSNSNNNNNVVAARLRQRLQRTRQASKLVSSAAAVAAKRAAAAAASTSSTPTLVAGSVSAPSATVLVHLPTSTVLSMNNVNVKTNNGNGVNVKEVVSKKSVVAAAAATNKVAVRAKVSDETTSTTVVSSVVASSNDIASGQDGVTVRGVAGVDLDNMATTKNGDTSTTSVSPNLP
jgi:hypothetical protein